MENPVFETTEQEKCYTLTDEIMNDRYTNDEQKKFVEDTLLGKTNTTDLQDILNEETNPTMQENLENLFNLAQKLDAEQLKMVYDEITDFNQHDTLNMASIKMRKQNTRNDLAKGLT